MLVFVEHHGLPLKKDQTYEHDTYYYLIYFIAYWLCSFLFPD
jgi:hypothetical protein